MTHGDDLVAATYSTLKIRDGVEIVVSTMGNSRLGATLVALPGWKGTDLGLRGLCRATLEMGFRVVAVNPPGNGRSPAPPSRLRRLADLTEVMLEAIQRLPKTEDSVILLGHSFGATVATALAANRPPWLQGLVLVSPVVKAPAVHPGLSGRFSQAVVNAGARVLGGAPRPVADAYLRSRLIEDATNIHFARSKFGGAREILMRSRIERGILADPRSVADHLRMAGEHGCIDFAAQVRCCVEVLAGDSDQMSPLAELEMLRAQMTNARLRLVPGAGHLAHHENSYELSRLTADCVRTLSAKFHGISEA